MNVISGVRFQGQQTVTKATQPSFRAGTGENIVDVATDAIGKVKKTPDEAAIKGGIAAVMTVVGLFLAKNAAKMQKFIEKNAQSPNKFLKVISVVAGLVLSLLSVLGASSLFKEKTEQPKETANNANEGSQ